MEKLLHTISGFLHILAAVTWIGSMIYSQFAVAPALKHLGAPKASAINMIATGHFSPLTWTSLVVLIVTGTYATIDKAEKLTPFFQQPAGIVLFIKLLLVAALIVILLVQIYNYGPKMKKLINPATPKNQGAHNLSEVTDPKLQQMLKGMEMAARNNYSTLSQKMSNLGIV
ncbi:hypothetical protein L7E55_04820 [Pelotomaculum isophthalicicum JI]|uniref:Copper resistance protein D domain-containing protein n=1 Tax=Pelotomaculum isophthalicicum JI TaxID=947010 RepID=A0A9X4H0Z1_9FIRM|nr:DUF4149 domain-containing protein [Pelotomaculum isophthalicicum]MDF9407686.1 hypothetical protein [Pelotomaculum isophthalicicum JI]